MNINKTHKYIIVTTLLFVAFILLIPSFSIAQTDSASTSLPLLVQKVDLLNDINGRVLNSVYWTLGVLVAIFVAIISVNLYFNISANKREIQKIKQDIIDSTKNQITSAGIDILDKLEKSTGDKIDNTKREIEASIGLRFAALEEKMLQKINTDIPSLINKESTNLSNVQKNETLNVKAELTKAQTEFEKRVQIDVAKNSSKIVELSIAVKELEAYKYHKEGKMGGILLQIDALNDYITFRPALLHHKLKDIKDIIKEYELQKTSYDRLNKLLDAIPKGEHDEIIKEIKSGMVLRREV